MKRHFYGEDTRWAYEEMLNIFVFRGMQIKPKYYCALIRMANIPKHSQYQRLWRVQSNRRAPGPLTHHGGTGRGGAGGMQNLLTQGPSSHTPRYLLNWVENLCPHTKMFTATLLMTAKSQKEPRYLSKGEWRNNLVFIPWNIIQQFLKMSYQATKRHDWIIYIMHLTYKICFNQLFMFWLSVNSSLLSFRGVKSYNQIFDYPEGLVLLTYLTSPKHLIQLNTPSKSPSGKHIHRHTHTCIFVSCPTISLW